MDTPPVRVMVCDDSGALRRLISRVLTSERGIEVSATAENGRDALDQIRARRPDLLVLDIEMPVLDGLSTLKELRSFDRSLPVIMFSTLTNEGSSATLEALARGAHDYVPKPAGGASFAETLERVRAELVPRIYALTQKHGGRAARRPVASGGSESARTDLGVVAIGASTGGPQALAELIPRLPTPFPTPILIAQHMPPAFTRIFGRRLGEISNIPSCEAKHGQRVEANHIYLAPGGFHMTVRNRVIHLDTTEKLHGCRPAVDPLFESMAVDGGRRVLAVVLTGMGVDGARGAMAVRKAGGVVLAQDQASSLVYGMPRAAAKTGAAHGVVSLDDLPNAIARCVSGAMRSGVGQRPAGRRASRAGMARPPVDRKR